MDRELARPEGDRHGVEQRMQSSRPRVRLLHTADIHIDDDYNPARRLAGLAAVVEASIRYDVDAVLVVGDLFDHSRAEGGAVAAALGQLARLRAPTIVTVGNHDSLATPSIYERVSPLEAGDHVHFLDDPAGGYAVLDPLGLTVWARAMIEHERDHNPIAGYRPRIPAHWQVAMAHGFYSPAGKPIERSSPIREEEMGELGCDYLALGHWHRFADVSVNGVPAYYPGSPSEKGGTFAGANLVTLDPEMGVSVERIRLPER